MGLSGSEQGPVAGSCKHGNEPSVSIKVGNYYSLRLDLHFVLVSCKIPEQSRFNCLQCRLTMKV